MITARDIEYTRPQKSVYVGISPDGHRIQIVRLGKGEWVGAVKNQCGDVVGKVYTTSYRYAKDECYELMIDYPNMVRI